MKSLIIINEPFTDMALGRNTTLAYIVSCLDLGHEVFIYNLTTELPKSSSEHIKVISLNDKTLNKSLVESYKQSNQQIMLAVENKNLGQLLNLKISRIAKFFPQKIELDTITLSEVDFVIQRLEPMKAPFPPVGTNDVNDVLTQLKNLFPACAFNCPINLGDKDTPLEINHLLQKKIATPTAEFKLGDQELTKVLNEMVAEYQEIYGGDEAKIVLKPKNSAQSLGVFAISFTENGLDLTLIKEKSVTELQKIQNYQIKNNLNVDDLGTVIEILCYIQNAPKDSDECIKDIDPKTIFSIAKRLYKDEILIQPFLEGVKFGDIRSNLLKNSAGNFYLAGSTVRKSMRQQTHNFTTTYSTGGATSQPISILNPDEIRNLDARITDILHILNGVLKEKYRNTIELGLDFLLVGDDRNIFLGEINHHCQALIPISEAMARAVDKSGFYEGGLGLIKQAVKHSILSQKAL